MSSPPPPNDLAELVLKEQWRASPELFAARWSKEIAGFDFEVARHIAFIAERVAARVLEGNARVAISCPPRHGKTELLAVWLPLWLWSIRPSARIGLVSYSERLVRQAGRRLRNALKSHGRVFGVELAEDSAAVDQFATTAGGGFLGTPLGGGVTGFGFDLLLVDDTTKGFLEAFSPHWQETIGEKWASDLSTRIEPGGSVVALQTRWHARDLLGQLVADEPDRWEEIVLPALAEDDDPLGRAPGEALWPERYPVEALEPRRQRGGWEWRALYQGRPASESSSSPVSSDDIVHWDARELPPIRELRIVQSWDPSHEAADPTAKKRPGKRSKVAGQAWGFAGGRAYLLDQVCEHLNFDETEEAMVAMTSRWPTTREILVEKTANGPGLIGRLLVRLPELLEGRVPAIRGVKPEGSKFFRLAGVSGYFRAHQVLLPPVSSAPWVSSLVERLVTFPGVEWDDDIDALSQALNEEWLPAEEEAEITASVAADEWSEILRQGARPDQRWIDESEAYRRAVAFYTWSGDAERRDDHDTEDAG